MPNIFEFDIVGILQTCQLGVSGVQLKHLFLSGGEMAPTGLELISYMVVGCVTAVWLPVQEKGTPVSQED